ncbi:hypothetical protein KAR91_71470 [Candidatus Pacearchaeota archaeon]|nr:hypothetical protein [Candidatus Pacearchaeota archaeon]
MELWNAFLDDYKHSVKSWPLHLTLELFWHFCQDGNRAVKERLNSKLNPKQAECCKDMEPDKFGNHQKCCICGRHVPPEG